MRVTLGAKINRMLDWAGERLFPHAHTLNPHRQLACEGPAIMPPQIFYMQGSPAAVNPVLEAQKEQFIINLIKLHPHMTQKLARQALDPVFTELEGVFSTKQPQIERNLRVAKLLCDWGVSINTIAAAVLTGIENIKLDVLPEKVRDTIINRNELNNFESSLDAEDQIDNLRDLFFLKAKDKDFEVILLLCAEDLTDMHLYSPERDLANPPFKVKRALYITAWMLVFFGNEIKGGELADLAFPHCKPEAYAIAYNHLKKLSANLTSNEEKLKKLAEITDELHLALEIADIPHAIISRCKTKASAYQSLAAGKKTSDGNGLRIITPSEPSEPSEDKCFEVLSCVSRYLTSVGWVEDLAQYSDYIHRPKGNNYQSIHAVFEKDGFVFEVQIRDQEMDRVAETGTACRPSYKLGENFATPKAESPQEIAQARFDKKKDKLNKEGVVIASDVDGKLLHRLISENLPPSVSDFAFHLGIETGLTASRGKINGRNYSLDTKIEPGDTIEIITGPKITAKTAAARLQFTTTALARAVLVAFSRNINLGTRATFNQTNLIAAGEIIFQNIVKTIHNKMRAKFSAQFSCPSPQLIFSIKKLAIAKGFNNETTLYLALALMEPAEVTAFAEKIAKRLTEDLLLLFGIHRNQATTEFEIICVNNPQIISNILEVFKKSMISIRALSFEQIKGTPYCRLELKCAKVSGATSRKLIKALEESYPETLLMPGKDAYSPRNASLTIDVKPLLCSERAIPDILQRVIGHGAMIHTASFPAFAGITLNRDKLRVIQGEAERAAVWQVLQTADFITKSGIINLKFPLNEPERFLEICQSAQEKIGATRDALTIAFYILQGLIQETSATRYEIIFRLPLGKRREAITTALEAHYNEQVWVKRALKELKQHRFKVIKNKLS